MAIDLTSHFPQAFSLSDGRSIELRVLNAQDRGAILGFAQNLPEEDLLFLSIDLTDPAVVDGWLKASASGQSITLCAYEDDALVGYGTVHREAAPWMQRVGEIRVNVAPNLRSAGLGRVLISKIFDIAQGLQLRKLLARMTTEQTGAQAVFRKLGFTAEALLADFVEDRKGQPHDLVMMTYDLDGLTDQAGAPVKL